MRTWKPTRTTIQFKEGSRVQGLRVLVSQLLPAVYTQMKATTTPCGDVHLHMTRWIGSLKCAELMISCSVNCLTLLLEGCSCHGGGLASYWIVIRLFSQIVAGREVALLPAIRGDQPSLLLAFCSLATIQECNCLRGFNTYRIVTRHWADGGRRQDAPHISLIHAHTYQNRVR